jgi:hypothetical protein
MRTFLLQAPRDFVDAGIKKGYIIQVPSQVTGSSPQAYEVKEALIRAGFSGRALSWASPGNWIVKELKI